MKQIPPIRLGILLSGGGTTMLNLADWIAAKRLNAQIACVISSTKNAGGIARAQALGLPVQVINKKACGSAEAFSARIAEQLRAQQVELVCMAGFLALWQIPADFQWKVMNIHPSLLPMFGGPGMHGAHVHEAVLAAGETESGCTVHFANNEYDAGPIILQRRCAVLRADTPLTLAARVFTEECKAYPQAIQLFQESVLTPRADQVVIRKVVAYVTPADGGADQILVFDHVDVPEAGVQVPAGTMHAGEAPDAAVLRETEEETGLTGLRIVRKIGVYDWLNPVTGCVHERHVYHLIVQRPEVETWEWIETSGGEVAPEDGHRFRLYWADIRQVNLTGGQGDMLGEAFGSSLK